MTTTLKQTSRLVMADFEIADDYFREYTADNHEGGTYIDPARVTVAIDPDTAKCAVTLTGPTTRGVMASRHEADHLEMFGDFLDALDAGVDPLVRDSVAATIRASATLSAVFDVDRYLT